MRNKDLLSSEEHFHYLDLQTNKYKSHEFQNPHWEAGQKRYIETVFANVSRNLKILDISCGDGVGLRQFKTFNFTDVTGFEYDDEKVDFAKQSGYPVLCGDFHDLSIFENDTFDLVYSSHSLEHARYPGTVLEEFERILKPNGLLYLVLPYPDFGPLDAHCAKIELGTDNWDEGNKVSKYIIDKGFQLVEMSFDNFREPEIWLIFKKGIS